jgi:hypothetical protein
MNSGRIVAEPLTSTGNCLSREQEQQPAYGSSHVEVKYYVQITQVFIPIYSSLMIESYGFAMLYMILDSRSMASQRTERRQTSSISRYLYHPASLYHVPIII